MSASTDHRASRKGVRRREAVIEAAARLFAAYGYEKVSIQDVAHEVGILKGSLYYYFDAKEDLLFHVLLRNHKLLHDHVVRAVDYASLDPLDAVSTFVQRHVEYVLSNPEISGLYVQEQAVVRSRDDWRNDLRVIRKHHEDSLLELLRAAAASGAAYVDDAALTTRALLSMANGAHRWYRSSPQSSRASIAEHHAAFAARALRLNAFGVDSDERGSTTQAGRLPPA